MRHKFSKNVKGTVLLTVICFTTMCMVIAAIALRVASHSNNESTKNVMKAQAQITAEHYLQQYLSTFPSATGTDGKARTNFDMLKTIAGANSSTPQVIKIQVQPSVGTLTSVNISDDNLERTAVYGGNCRIEVYKDGGNGVVVRAEANYNGETGVASAYFYGETPSADLNKNAIECCGEYDVENGADVNGDVLIDTDSPDGVIRFNNSKAGYYSNYNTNGNLSMHTNAVKFHDTIQENAPTITVGGHLYVWQLEITTTVGKTDVNGNTRTGTSTPGTTYQRNNLLNKNGYINVDKKFIALCNPSGLKIGDSTNDIDIYCHGMIFGQPLGIRDGDSRTLSYGGYSAATVKNFADKIKAIGGGHVGNNSGNFDLYGNVYCRKREGGTIEDDGDFMVTNESIKIHGDLCVEGNIYVRDGGSLQVYGQIVCKGTINGTIKNGTGAVVNNAAVGKTWPGTARAETPPKNYAPGLYVFGENDNPVINSPKNYRALSTNKMYQDKSAKSKNFQTHFNNTLKYGLNDKVGTTPVSTGYSDDSMQMNTANITINKSVTLTEKQVACAGPGLSGAKYTVNVTTEDIYILIPVKRNATTQIGARFIVNNPGNKHHCYIAFYEPSGVSIVNGKSDASKVVVNKANWFYKHDDYSSTTRPVIQWCSDTNNGKLWLGTSACEKVANATYASSDLTKFNTHAKSNIVVLIPDGTKFELGCNGHYGAFNAVFYGPKCEFVNEVNVGCKIFGQVKSDVYKTDECENATQSVHFADLEEDSILHAWLTQGNAAAGTLNLQYFIKAK